MAILIVDDSATQRLLLRGLLKRSGQPAILEVDSAEACFTLLGARGDEIDTILMDVNMPGMNGIDACRKIKGEQRWSEIPVIIVTAEAQADTLVDAFAAGANDYLNKPVTPIELTARVRAALALKAATDQRRAHERQIAEIGAVIQQRLLAGHRPAGIVGARIATWNRPSSEMDGDFFEFFKHHRKCFDLVIADVMGKGLPAALLGAAVKNRFFGALTCLLARQRSGGQPTPAQIVSRVHHEMTGELIRLNTFVTLCYARLDLAALTLELVDAGHPKTILYRSGCREARLIEGDNTPLGFVRKERYRSVSIPLFPGDLIFFYSDGLTEAPGPDGELFGTRRLRQCLAQVAGHSAEAVIEAVRYRLDLFTRSLVRHDDLTCVAVRIEDDTARAARLQITSELEQLSVVRDFISGFCANSQTPVIDEQDIWHLSLSINEALTNVIRHAYGDQEGQPIRIAAVTMADRIRVEIAHFGRQWSPSATPLPQTAALNEGGYGLFIMENFIDEVSYRAGEGVGNCIILEKRLKPQPKETPGDRDRHDVPAGP